jgi:FlaA1/EpsC-like NDP-sugar epimerase
MTRFLLPMSAAVDAVLLALAWGGREIWCCGRLARIVDVARALIATAGGGHHRHPAREKLHEVLIAAEESHRAEDFGTIGASARCCRNWPTWRSTAPGCLWPRRGRWHRTRCATSSPGTG